MSKKGSRMVDNSYVPMIGCFVAGFVAGFGAGFGAAGGFAYFGGFI